MPHITMVVLPSTVCGNHSYMAMLHPAVALAHTSIRVPLGFVQYMHAMTSVLAEDVSTTVKSTRL
jgi:hypothetical protein